VDRPYTLTDLRRELGDLVGDRAFADTVFDRHVLGREVMDYARLLGLAGYLVRRVAPDRAWMGSVPIQEDARGLLIGGDRFGGRSALVPFGTPAYAAGLDRGDLVVAIDGQAATMAGWQAVVRRRPGDQVPLTVERRDGRRVSVTLTLSADPTVQIVPAEATGPISDAARLFREAWLRTRVP
jgi:predicted metalloprotease with PDZ domain